MVDGLDYEENGRLGVTFDYKWQGYSVAISMRDDGPKAWKQYRRGERVFWRNYRRDVPGGVTFLQRYDEMTQTTIRAYREKLSQEIFHG